MYNTVHPFLALNKLISRGFNVLVIEIITFQLIMLEIALKSVNKYI